MRRNARRHIRQSLACLDTAIGELEAGAGRRENQMMSWVRARAVRWVSDERIPGWVEVHRDLADGTTAALFDKPPVFTADDDLLRPDTAYPVTLALACRTAADASATDEAVSVTLLHGVSALDGTVTFHVRSRDVEPLVKL